MIEGGVYSFVINAAKAKQILRTLWVLAILTVIIGSVLPSDSSPIQALDRLQISDKFEHVAAYLVLALLPALHEKRRFVLLSAVGAIALGVGLEYVQLYSGWRDFEFADAIADAIGVCVGLGAGIVVRSIMATHGIPGFSGITAERQLTCGGDTIDSNRPAAESQAR
jgi:VanZ family protein